ncbi:phosphatidylserine decarboxylase [Candidatus Chloroploca sp. M-50]|uniref:Phosphatidylserine decarboxylase n=1 Tax=Candidatus Chloroploca mongolica TaxID=2528176 RepID=A0ABS4DAJ1_9CHLR|nr:phosphatidylserine decarboxylase [Candidatus Chloroploca mongolica]MBP1466476.1 phosphatidylserine decarboxylase [Candidatus Chloroploca mongolica]
MPEQTLPNERPQLIPGLDPEATPLLGLGLGLTGLTLGLRPRFAAVPLALTALTAALYRDPERTTPYEPATLFAVADGVVLNVDDVYEHRFIHSDCLRISIGISALNVPFVRSPVAGMVRLVEHVAGEFRSVGDAEAGDRNDRIYLGLHTEWGPILLAMIAGPIGRRLVCRVRPGDRVDAGTRLGTARFGTRADLYLQRDSARLQVQSGDRLTAGTSRLGMVVPL